MGDLVEPVALPSNDDESKHNSAPRPVRLRTRSKSLTNVLPIAAMSVPDLRKGSRSGSVAGGGPNSKPLSLPLEKTATKRVERQIHADFADLLVETAKDGSILLPRSLRKLGQEVASVRPDAPAECALMDDDDDDDDDTLDSAHPSITTNNTNSNSNTNDNEASTSSSSTNNNPGLRAHKSAGGPITKPHSNINISNKHHSQHPSGGVLERLQYLSLTTPSAPNRSGNAFSLADRLLFTKIREMVSLKKRRFKTDNFNLDLSYITDRIIAMGFPSEEREGLYRNPMDQVVRFFETRHQHHYRVYNLCSEPNRKYDHSRFPSGRVVEMGFPDHNPPPFALIAEFCKDADEWLNRHPENIVATHCKAGKGRTGTLICCLFLYLKEFEKARDALEYFSLMRTVNRKGVTIPSQRRYVVYFEQYLQAHTTATGLMSPVPPLTLRVASITFQNIPRISSTGCEPYFVIKNYETEHNTKLVLSVEQLVVAMRTHTFVFPPATPLHIQGDTRLTCYHKAAKGDDVEMFSFWMHTGFVENFRFALTKPELDGGPRKDKKHAIYHQDFALELDFEPLS